MPVSQIAPPALIDLETSSNGFTVVCSRFSQMRVEPVLDSGTWTTGIITVQTSVSQINWYDLDDPLTLTAEAMSVRVPLDGISVVRFNVTTNQAGTPGEVGVYLSLDGTTIEASLANDLQTFGVVIFT